MTHRFLSRIYRQIEEKMWEVKTTRGMKHGASDGIMIMDDPLALYYQKLDRVRLHVGCHGFAERDREHGMKSAQCLIAIQKYGRKSSGVG